MANQAGRSNFPRAARLSAILTLLLAGCTGGTAAPAGKEDAGQETGYRIVATTAMVADIVREVAGEHAEVTSLMGTGVDPHLFKPSAGDHAKLREADVVFFSGLGLEAGMDSVLRQAAERGRPVFAVTENIDPAYLKYAEEFQEHPDPHVWMDVAAWSECVQFVADQLAEYDPPHAADYRANAARYRGELAELDAYVRRVIAGIPEPQRYLVTAHDAFEYFSDAYGIQVRSVLGITTESEAGVEDINALVEFLVSHQVPAVFVESSVNSRNLEAVIEGAARRGWTVRVGGTLYSDAMGAPGTYEGTYVGMIDHNATVIARALGGEVPAAGLHGKLRVE